MDPLTDIQTGKEVIIRRIHEFAEDNPELLKFLIGNEILPGSKAQLLNMLPFNQTLTIQVGAKTVTLGFPAARFIFVEISKEA